MTDAQALEIIENQNLINGEYVLLSYTSAAGKK
jgi:hypothetical protein